MGSLDDSRRGAEIRQIIRSKPALERFYREMYERFRASLAGAPSGGLAIEIGAGAGFAKEAVGGLLATDILPYPGLDLVMDATRLPFASGSLRFIGMLDAFHHIPDVAAFLGEADRCLAPGGRLLIIDQHVGWLSGWILKYLHHEPFNSKAESWTFATTGPLSGANGALTWIVFRRDAERFRERFPELADFRYEPIVPLWYWLAGGLKQWNLLPRWTWPVAGWLDRLLLHVSPQFGSFVEIEIVKRPGDGAIAG